ncbi:hypothetical protein [Oricola thermophila]|uniref:Uncharacterized protein n=1 Tax=Oricola thermophila TaxID=2742145 RepID=A0A6N1VCW1_9HYPH|nr:hypothetical protein [Oricola thermophila]QKV18746.1 hypothetical protein HTY61_09935 [Oricola thermophila]
MTYPRTEKEILSDMRELARISLRPQPLGRTERALLAGAAAVWFAACAAVALPRLFEIEAALKAAAGV